MPAYDYECSGCGRQVERLTTIARRHDAWTCPDCGGQMRLVIVSAPAAVYGSAQLWTRQAAPWGKAGKETAALQDQAKGR